MPDFHTDPKSINSYRHSSSTEPRICSNDLCSFPFGPPCPDCSLAFDIQETKNEKLRYDAMASKWIHKEINHDHEPSSSSGHVELIPTTDEVDLTSPLSNHSSSEATIIPSKSQESLQPTDDSETQSELSSSDSIVDYKTPEALDDWLSELFSNTLEAQLQNTHFIGGATDENSTLDFCPICYSPIGDPRDQHLLRCQYAHEEQERMEEFILRAEKRTRD